MVRNILKYGLQGHKSSSVGHREQGESKWMYASGNICTHLIYSFEVGLKIEAESSHRLNLTAQMFAEFHISSPLVKPRQMYFVRHSRQIDIATWVVVDVSLETIFPSPVLTPQRKPSGCVIQALQDGVSTVGSSQHTD